MLLFICLMDCGKPINSSVRKHLFKQINCSFTRVLRQFYFTSFKRILNDIAKKSQNYASLINVVRTSTISWYVPQCSLVEVHQFQMNMPPSSGLKVTQQTKKQATSTALLFGGLQCLHPQDRRKHQARNQEEAEICLLLAVFFSWFTLQS